ncbi:MAG TPA: hypothetical protein VMZ90_10105 [Vicinamibacterales bacterium]|nr:hypothetical protein [Vicinamibacterales bacterium]
MPRTTRILRIPAIALAFTVAYGSSAAHAQDPGRIANPANRLNAQGPANESPRLKVLRAAAAALGQIRSSDIGSGQVVLPLIDVVTTIHISASGTIYTNGQPSNVDYDAMMGYLLPAMRVQIKPAGSRADAKPTTIQTVRETYAWNDSELGAGLIPGKGTATPVMAEARARLLKMYILPYGVVKAAIEAGDKTMISTAQGSTVLTFPLSGPLAGVTVTATLDAKNLITKVVTKPDNAAATDLAYEAEYSDYDDHGEIHTDIQSPGRIVQRVAGKPFLDVKIKHVDANNPYLVFPIPANVKAARASQ